jgi:hypothetical protein
VAQPDYVVLLSRDLELTEECLQITRELNKASTVQDVRDILEAHRTFYLAMTPVVRGVFNDHVKHLFTTLPLSARLP